MSDRGVFAGRLAIEEKVMANESATDIAGGSVRRYADADELLGGGGSDCRQVALSVFSCAQPAALNCIACDVLHNDVSTPVAQEDEVNLRDAYNARRVGIHNLWPPGPVYGPHLR